MKRILYIGEKNEMINGMKSSLSQHFQLRLCSERVEIIKGMMKIANPDLVLICIHDFAEAITDVFDYLVQEYPLLPVFTLGSIDECNEYVEFFGSGQFDNIEYPVDSSTILRKCCERLDMDYHAIEQSMEEEEFEDSGKKRLLLVDDSAILLRNMKAMLQDIYNIEVATSGIQALAVLEAKEVDLILLDYEMPIVNGKMTFELIRKRPEFKDIPVIFLTGVADKKNVEDVLKLKPDGYFLKPPVREKFLAAIEKVLRKKELEREKRERDNECFF